MVGLFPWLGFVGLSMGGFFVGCGKNISPGLMSDVISCVVASRFIQGGGDPRKV